MDLTRSLIIETGAVALLFAAVFVIGGRVHPLRSVIPDRRSMVSFSGGMAAAYVFMHLMPEMHEARLTFSESISQHLPYRGMAIYFVALVGFLSFYSLDRLHAHLRETAEAGQEVRAFHLHLVGFAGYVALMSYLLVRKSESSLASTVLYAAAFAAHFLVLEHNLSEEHGADWKRTGRWVLAAMCLIGWGMGVSFELPDFFLALLIAFVSGAVIMTSTVMELPSGKDGRFVPFSLGGLLYGLLLLPLG